MSSSSRWLTPWRAATVVILSAGLWATLTRFGGSLSAATNMQDASPWGLWVGFDVLVGVGLAAGGFAIAATVHVFGLKKYAPIARPAVLTAFLGYVLVVVGLLFDLGKPWNGWHPLVMWNPHSVMFEVTWCVMLYSTVLLLELSPLLFDKLGLEAPKRWIHRGYIGLVIAGVLLSMMHQSSLGSLFLIVPDKLHGLWYTPWLPVFFFISAVAAGLAMTIIESYLSHRAFGRELEGSLLSGLGRAMAVVLGLFLVARTADLALRGNLGLAFAPTEEAVMLWGEMGLGVLLPIALLSRRAVRGSREGLFFAALLAMLGFVLGRLNVGITGMRAASGVDYMPSWMELAVSASLVVLGFMAFGWAVRNLGVFGPSREAHIRTPVAPPILGRASLLQLWGLAAAGLVLVLAVRDREASAAAPPPPPAVTHLEFEEPEALRLPAPFTFPHEDETVGPVTFDHRTHAELKPANCATCHDGRWSLVERGKLLVDLELVHDGVLDEGKLCGSCHDGKTAFDLKEDCESCHAELDGED
ncbi:MAG: Ni/Fe-hydrogenase cytochrome b subunit [Myxococcales bacterium]|nr:Ni/Fe-hydrogenase cytochrome b subunit [Myxococcales bacterium]